MGSRLMQDFHPLRAYWEERSGAAAAEFAIVLTVLIFPLLNVVDFGMYIYQGMELNEAAQSAAEAVLATCVINTNPAKLPATVFCDPQRAETAAAQSTSLASAVTVTNTSENFYCVKTASGALVPAPAGDFPDNPPVDCSALGGSSSDVPGDYILVTVSYTYSPMFTGVSLASQLPATMTRTAWMRLE